MSKKIEPIMGKPFEEGLDELTNGLIERLKTIQSPDEKISHITRIMLILNKLQKLVNKGVCITEYQQTQIETEAVKDVDVNRTLQLVAYINSVSLDCANCLNGQCEMRDPEKPVPEAPKVAEEK